MEDALALQLDGEMNGDWQESLNPCCNGRCTRTNKDNYATPYLSES